MVQCDSKEKLAVALIYRKKEFEPVAESTATLVIKASQGEPLRLFAVHRAWNERYGGFVVSGREPDVRAAIETIASAKKNVLVGIVLNGNQLSAEFSARGSTSAMGKIIEHCRIDEIGQP
ncbi:MAG: hypothetical protein Rhirs2KO_12590 [Rhizobiaceae bacterium]